MLLWCKLLLQLINDLVSVFQRSDSGVRGLRKLGTTVEGEASFFDGGEE
jgi:hypothetical protein